MPIIEETWRNKAIRLKKELHVVYLASRHPGTPWQARFLAGLALALAMSPVDLIPDFIPVLGYLDDLILIPWLLRLALRRIPAEVMEECRHEAEHNHRAGRSGFWAALFIAALWLLIIGLVFRWLAAWYKAGK